MYVSTELTDVSVWAPWLTEPSVAETCLYHCVLRVRYTEFRTFSWKHGMKTVKSYFSVWNVLKNDWMSFTVLISSTSTHFLQQWWNDTTDTTADISGRKGGLQRKNPPWFCDSCRFIFAQNTPKCNDYKLQTESIMSQLLQALLLILKQLWEKSTSAKGNEPVLKFKMHNTTSLSLSRTHTA